MLAGGPSDLYYNIVLIDPNVRPFFDPLITCLGPIRHGMHRILVNVDDLRIGIRPFGIVVSQAVASPAIGLYRFPTPTLPHILGRDV